MTADRASLELVETISSLTADDQREAFFALHPEHLEVDWVAGLCRDVGRIVRADLERAGHLAQTVRWLAERLDDDACRALGARATANVLHSAGDTEEAMELYEVALRGFIGLDDEREAAITRSSALLNLAYLGDYDRVFAWQEAARQAFDRLGDRLRLAILEHNFGNILYRQDRWAEALARYTLSYEEFLRLDRPQDVAVCLRNIAVCQISLYHFEEALEVYERARAYSAEHGLDRVALQVDYNIAYLYYMRGEYARAIQLFRRARQRCEAAGEEYHKALCDLDQAEIYLELNLVEEAAKLARSAWDSFERLKLPYEGAKALTNQAIAWSRQGMGEQALELLARGREIFVAEKNRLWPALIDFYRAIVLFRERRPREALALAEQAREVFADSAMASRAAMCDLLLAEVLLDLGDPGKARANGFRALERLADLELPALEYQAYLVLGRVEEAVGDPHAALEAYRQSHDRLEALRSQLHHEDLKIAFLKDKQVVYESLLWLTMRSKALGAEREEIAFDYIEQAKSRSLADLLAFRAHALPPRQPAKSEVAERVRHLREELNWFYRQIDLRALEGGNGAVEAIKRLRLTSRQREEELLGLLRELRTTDWELSSLQAGGVVELRTIRASLPAGATLIEYFIARGTVWVCVLDQDELRIEGITTAARTRELHRLLRFQLSKLVRGLDQVSAPLPLIEEATLCHLRELYDELIEPIRPYLTREHLVFVPHDFLHYLPFHALHDGESYLIDRFSISYAPSAGVFHLCVSKESRCERRSLVLGVADERAPQILEEVEAVASSLPDALLLTGDEASEEALRLHGEHSCYVHIATHSLFRRDHPMFSAIQLGGSRLSLFDLYDLRLEAELVVLSGCGTGLNAILGADELVGLTRGWLYAGAQSVLVTLWDVNDASTAVFMRCFYQHLSAGTPLASALRQAMRDIRRQYPQPYYWAPFVLVGKPGI